MNIKTKKFLDVKMLKNNALNLILLVDGIEYGCYYTFKDVEKSSINRDNIFEQSTWILKKLGKISCKNKKEKKEIEENIKI